MIDGAVLDPTSFGEFDDNDVWNPTDPSELTFGTNGFWLDFQNSNLGLDASSMGNDWSVTGSPTQTADTPTDDADDNIGNYAIMNLLDVYLNANNGSNTFSNGNKTYNQFNTGSNDAFRTTIGATSGKWYWELFINTAQGSYPVAGIVSTHSGITTSSVNESVVQRRTGEVRYQPFGEDGPGFNIPGIGYNTDDTIQFALDLDNGGFWAGINNTWLGGATQSEIEDGDTTNAQETDTRLSDGTLITPVVESSGSTTTLVMDPADWTYNAPDGFKAWNTANLPASAIANPEDHFKTITYTGTGAELDVDVGFQPDLVWIKGRDSGHAANSLNHYLFDSVRGAGNLLQSQDPDPETNNSNTLSDFLSNGFQVGTASNTNDDGQRYVAWCWKADGDTVSESATGVTTERKTASHGGFSIIKGDKTTTNNVTFNHGLSKKPDMIIVKDIVNSGRLWNVAHVGASTNMAQQARFYLNNNQAVTTNLGSFWGGEPTATTITISGGGSLTSASSASGILRQAGDTSGDFICYAFANTPGLIDCGSYTGNQDLDGPFIYTGFRPAFIMTKHTSAGAWNIWDSGRAPFNPADKTLQPHVAGVEGGPMGTNSHPVDILSNGFKIRTNNDDISGSGQTSIYTAFAEVPFDASPGTAQTRAR